MTAPYLLDTCAAIFLSTRQPVRPEMHDALHDAAEAGTAIYVSPVTAWEVGMLAVAGRVALHARPEAWFSRLLTGRGVYLADLTPATLIACSYLPGAFHRDPADRMLIATAREYGMRIVTRDRKILDYAEQGHVMALAC